MTQPNASNSRPSPVMPVVLLVAAAALATAAVLYFTGRPPALPVTDTGKPVTRTIDADKLAESLTLAENYRAQGEPGRAEALLRQTVADFPDAQGASIALAEFLVASRKFEDGYASYQRALAIGPSDATLQFAAGTVANMLGRTDRAIEHYAAAQAADNSDPRFPLYLAQVQAKANQLTEAKASLLIAGKLDPDNAVVWGTLADLFLREGKVPLALQNIAKARKLKPEVTVWRVIEARAMKRDNRPEDALAVLIGLSPAERLEPGVLSTMAECYGFLSRPEDAAKLYEAAVAAQPIDGALTLEWAVWLERCGKKEEALKQAERASLLLAKGADEVVERLKKP